MDNRQQEILTHWQIQENLLQHYRLFFMISQSVLISAGAMLVAFAGIDMAVLAFAALALPGLLLCRYWMQIVPARGLDVSFWQAVSGDPSICADENLLRFFKTWQRRSKYDKEMFLQDHGIEPSMTRRTMEGIIPLLFVGAWTILTVAFILQAMLTVSN